jgi:cytochrome c biogenesis protein CcdA/thiol-disulfide isomerase/thioredoxin
MTLLIVSFVAGVLTVLAPCVLPVMPVIIGGSVTGERNTRRAFVITVSLATSVFLFTLLLKVSTAFISIPPQVWQGISGGILIAVAIFMLFPGAWDEIAPQVLNLQGNKLIGKGYQKKSIGGDILIGAALGPVFSSCSPTYFILLATVLPAHPVTGIFYLIAYCLGLALMLGLVAVLGQKIIDKLGLAADPKGWVKRVIGAIFLVLGILIFFGIDKKIEAALPSSAYGISVVEQKILSLTNATGQANGGIPVLTGSGDTGGGAVMASSTATSTPAMQASGATTPELARKAMLYPKAPELASPDAYLNTGGQPIKISQYKGKNVVLIDFWTYSCINCLRTVPYLTSWYSKYKDQGLVIIGVHTPEFSFEHVQSNVEDALKRLGITYPVVLDNEYKTWNAFGNQYWPREYLIDIDGYVVHDHAGEGEYDVTEKAIQAALAERATRLGTSAAAISTNTTVVADPNLSAVQSPETYFGANRNQYLGNGTPSTIGVQSFTLPTTPPNANTLYLGGSWDMELENASTVADGDTVEYFYKAHDIYIVASADTPTVVDVTRDGQPVGSFAGADVDSKTSTVTISGQRLYKLVHDTTPGAHTIKLLIHGKGVHAYTFTFG